jgi:hypothetical protein
MKASTKNRKTNKNMKESPYMVALATHSMNIWETGGEGVLLIQLAYNGA